MAERSHQGGVAGEQSSPSELVKSMAISSAELWHEVLDRLTQVQQSQIALAHSIDDLGSIIKSALPSLAEAASATQTLPPPVPQQAEIPTLPPSFTPTPPQAGASSTAQPPPLVQTSTILQPPPVGKPPVSTPTGPPLPGAPLGGVSQNPFLSQAPPTHPGMPSAPPIPGAPPTPPPGGGMPSAPPATPPSAPQPGHLQETSPQQVTPPNAGMPNSPTEVPEPLFFVPPLEVQTADTGGHSATLPPSPVSTSPVTAPPVAPAPSSLPPASALSQPIPSQAAASKAGIAPPPEPPTMPKVPASTSLPGDALAKPSATPVKPAEPINIVQEDSNNLLDAILATEFSDAGFGAGNNLHLAESTALAATKQPVHQIAGESQLDSLLGKEFSAAPTGMTPTPVSVSTELPEPPATTPASQPGFQVSPASIMAESPRQQAPSATMPQTPAPAPSVPPAQGLPQVPHLSAPPPMMPMPTHAPIPETPPEPPAKEEVAPKSIIESLPKIEKPTVIQPLPVTPGMPPPAMGFEIPEPMLGGLAGQPVGTGDSDAFSMARQIQEASPEEPEEEERKEAPISEDIVLGRKQKKASRFFRL